MYKSDKSYFIGLSIFISLLIILLGFIYLKFRVNEANEIKGKELEAIARLKSDQISGWLADKMVDANAIAHNKILINQIEKWLVEPNEENMRNVADVLATLKGEHGCEQIYFTDKNGSFLLSSEEENFSIAPYLQEKAKQSFQTGSVVSTDLYKCPVHNTVHIDFIAPLASAGKGVPGALVFQFDPYKFLFPLIQSWPTLSKSSETLLYKKVGDSILFLNELKHKKNSALNYSLPLTDTDVVAVKALIASYEGFVEANDYAGNKVLGYVMKIPGTEWIMVSKTDKKELFSVLYYEMVIVILLVIFLLLFFAAGMAFLYNLRQKSIFRDLYKQQESYFTTLKSIGDAVISTNVYGEVEYLNPVAEQLTGWLSNEAQGRKLEEVFIIINEETREAVENPVHKVLNEGIVVGLANHTLLLSKDGREIPIADSGAPIKGEKGEITGVVLVFRDQTEEREYQLKIARSEVQYRELVESTDSIAWEYDVEKDVWIYVAPQVIPKLGWLPEQWTNLDFWKRNIHPDERESSARIFFECIAKGEPHTLEYRFKSKEGSYIWIRDVVAVESQENKPVKLRGVMFDITERKNAEIGLKEKNMFIQTVLDNLPIGVALNKIDSGTAFYLNQKFEEIYGWKASEFKDVASFFEKVYPDENYRNEMVKLTMDGIESGDPLKMHWENIEITRSDGTKGFVNAVNIPLPGQNTMVSTVMDITLQAMAKMELKESEERFRKSVLLAPIPIMVHDEDGKVINISEGWTHYSGYSIKDIPTLKAWTERAYGLKAMEVENYISGLFSEEKTVLSGEFEIVTKSGEIRIWNFYTTPLGKLSSGKKLMLSMAPDITRRKRVQQELIAAKEKAEESERLKTAFLANMSHEIRTPLNGILGFTSLLTEDENLTQTKRKEFAAIINKSGEGLLKIINDILDISRLETSKAGIEQKPFDSMRTLSTIYSVFQKKMEDTGKENVELIVEKPGSSLILNTDETRLIQIFSNLLDNALRFTSKGSVTFGVSGQNENSVEFFVADTGVGIPTEKHEEIFDRFSQADNNSTRSYGGTGLGLAIVKKLLELMGSEITVESEPGLGACFRFRLPCFSLNKSDASASKIKTDSPANIRKLRILVVEDDLVSRIYFREILNRYPGELFFAETGEEALQFFETHKPDIILMDIRLPDIDGLEIVHKIREKDKQVTIIAQTAFAMSEDKQKAIEAGCNDYLAKPIKVDLLFQKLNQLN